MMRRWTALPVYCWHYGWNDNVRVVGELDHLVAMRHWVKVCCVYDVYRRTDGGTLNYACGYALE